MDEKIYINSEQPPTEEDANYLKEVLAFDYVHCYGGRNFQSVRDYPEVYVFWMHYPTMPEKKIAEE